jgi:anti-anti-sigma factor
VTRSTGTTHRLAGADKVMVLDMNAHAREGQSDAAPAPAPAAYGPEAQADGPAHSPACLIRTRGADLVLTGEIDLRNVDEVAALITAWLHDGHNHLDLAAVDFIDSMGLSVLVRAYTLSGQRGASLRITCSPTVHTVLSMAGFIDRLPGLEVSRSHADEKSTPEHG